MSDRREMAVSRRSVARGVAWSAPVVVLAAAAPATAGSLQDVEVRTTPCTKASAKYNNIPFTVSTVRGAVIPAGTVFTVDYAGGSTRPTWSGALAAASTAVITPKNDWSINGGRYGKITFTLNSAMPAGVTWDLVITMDIGAVITNQKTRLSLTTPLAGQNFDTGNDSASHSMFFGQCGD